MAGGVEDPLKFVEIKNPFGSLQTNPQADAWWVGLLFVFEKIISMTITISTYQS